jgi:hypothetical protein
MPLSVSMDKVITEIADEILLTYGGVFKTDCYTRDKLIHHISTAVSRTIPPQLIDLSKELAGRWRFVRETTNDPYPFIYEHWYLIPADKEAQFEDEVFDPEYRDHFEETFEQYRLKGPVSDVTFTDPDRTVE